MTLKHFYHKFTVLENLNIDLESPGKMHKKKYGNPVVVVFLSAIGPIWLISFFRCTFLTTFQNCVELVAFFQINFPVICLSCFESFLC